MRANFYLSVRCSATGAATGSMLAVPDPERIRTRRRPRA